MILPKGRRSLRSPAHKGKFIGSDCATIASLVDATSLFGKSIDQTGV
jgi:hypothetical protein